MDLTEVKAWMNENWAAMPQWLRTIIIVVLILSGPPGWIAGIICACIMHSKTQEG